MDEDPTDTKGKALGIEMSDEQIQILAATVSNVPKALGQIRQDLAQRIRQEQETVADRRRDAQVNQDLLKLRLR